MTHDPPHTFVSRGGLKLSHALAEFAVNPAGRRCADLGCSTGGFTDCLLQAGAAHVTSVDTAYGEFAWKLRNDPRVTLLERTNALHAPPPPPDFRPTLGVIDLGWTPQRLCLPVARSWLAAAGDASIITLIKPHYELERAERSRLHRGVLPHDEARRITDRVVDALPEWGLELLGLTESPITGGKDKKDGNTEWLAHLRPLPSAPPLR